MIKTKLYGCAFCFAPAPCTYKGSHSYFRTFFWASVRADAAGDRADLFHIEQIGGCIEPLQGKMLCFTTWSQNCTFTVHIGI